jgi:predicted nuclease with TOPRIM domain
MDAANQDDLKYASPPWAQRWFLKRSRDGWKNKYMGLKAEAKKQANRVNDVTKSRDKWRAETEQLREQLEAVKAEKAALQEQLAGLKKTGTVDDT